MAEIDAREMAIAPNSSPKLITNRRVLDADALTKKLSAINNSVVAKFWHHDFPHSELYNAFPSVEEILSFAKEYRDFILHSGGRPTRAIKDIPLNADADSRRLQDEDEASEERCYWGSEATIWSSFLLWRESSFTRRKNDGLIDSHAPFLEPSHVGQYELHLELQDFLRHKVQGTGTFGSLDWKSRLTALESQLREMQGERSPHYHDGNNPATPSSPARSSIAKSSLRRTPEGQGSQTTRAVTEVDPPLSSPRRSKRNRSDEDGVEEEQPGPSPKRRTSERRPRRAAPSVELPVKEYTQPVGQHQGTRPKRTKRPSNTGEEEGTGRLHKLNPKKRRSTAAAAAAATVAAAKLERSAVSKKRSGAAVRTKGPALPKKDTAIGCDGTGLRRSARLALLPRKKYS